MTLVVAFMRALQAWFGALHIDPPVSRVYQDTADEWLVLELQDMNKPSARCMEVVRQGFYVLEGQKLYPGLWEGSDNLPSHFYHGTDISGAISILRARTIKATGELGLSPHTPDGVYSFGLEQRSLASSYVVFGGCQICFRSPGLVMTMANSGLFRVCPPGVILRTWRSSAKRFKAAGREWIHNSESIELLGLRIRPQTAIEWLQSPYPDFCRTIDLVPFQQAS